MSHGFRISCSAHCQYFLKHPSLFFSSKINILQDYSCPPVPTKMIRAWQLRQLGRSVFRMDHFHFKETYGNLLGGQCRNSFQRVLDDHPFIASNPLVDKRNKLELR